MGEWIEYVTSRCLARARHVICASGGGREKGVRGVKRACHTGQQQSLQSALSPKEMGRDLASRTLTWCGALACSEGSIPPSSTALKMAIYQVLCKS